MAWVLDDETIEAPSAGRWTQEGEQLASKSIPAVKQQRSAGLPVKPGPIIKPKADYASTVGIFGSPPFIPNPGGMFTHAGKTLKEHGAGIKQLATSFIPGVDYSEDVKETWRMKELYDSYEHSTGGQVAGFGLNVLPYMAGGPGAMNLASKAAGKLGASATSKELGSLATQMGYKEGRMLMPGIEGMTTGGAHAGSYMVDPNLSADEQWKQRLTMAGTGAALGGAIDLLGSAGSNLALRRQGSKDMKAASEGLDVPVRTPPARLYPERRPDINRLNRLATNEPTFKMATDRAADVVARANKDIHYNIDAIRKEATGTSVPTRPGEAAGGYQPLNKLRDSIEASRVVRDKAVRDNLLDSTPIAITDPMIMSGLRDKIGENLAVSGASAFVTGKFREKFKNIFSTLNETPVPLGGRSGKTRVGDLNKLIKAERDLLNIADESFDAMHSKVAKSAALDVRNTIDDVITKKQYVSHRNASKPAVARMLAADKAKKDFSTSITSPAIRKAISSKDGGVTSQDFMASILQGSDTKGLQEVLNRNPDAKVPLRQEMLAKLFVPGKEADGFDLDKFVINYKSISRPVMKELFDKSTMAKLDKLEKVTRLNIASPESKRFAPRTGGWKESAVAAIPDAGDVAVSIPLVGQLGPKQLSDYFFSGRQRSGKPHALGSIRSAGPVAGVLTSQHPEAVIDTKDGLIDRLRRTYLSD